MSVCPAQSEQREAELTRKQRRKMRRKAKDCSDDK
jgi:hypothetical protein